MICLLTARGSSQMSPRRGVRFDSSDFYGRRDEFTATRQMWRTHVNGNGATLSGLWWTLVSVFYDWRSAVNPQCVYVLYSVSVCEFALVREETMYTVCYVPVRMHVSVCESSVFVWILQIIVCFLVLRSIRLTWEKKVALGVLCLQTKTHRIRKPASGDVTWVSSSWRQPGKCKQIWGCVLDHLKSSFRTFVVQLR